MTGGRCARRGGYRTRCFDMTGDVDTGVYQSARVREINPLIYHRTFFAGLAEDDLKIFLCHHFSQLLHNFVAAVNERVAVEAKHRCGFAFGLAVERDFDNLLFICRQ